jgi:hypothetical protein
MAQQNVSKMQPSACPLQEWASDVMSRLAKAAARAGRPMLCFTAPGDVLVADAMRFADDCGADYSEVF